MMEANAGTLPASEIVPQQSYEFNPLMFDPAGDVDLFGMFDPAFNLETYDAQWDSATNPIYGPQF